jgi:hypothetical protein
MIFRRHIINEMIQLKNGQIHLTLNKHDTEFINIVKQLEKKTANFSKQPLIFTVSIIHRKTFYPIN